MMAAPINTQSSPNIRPCNRGVCDQRAGSARIRTCNHARIAANANTSSILMRNTQFRSSRAGSVIVSSKPVKSSTANAIQIHGADFAMIMGSGRDPRVSPTSRKLIT
jgi:hypothetical protein